MSRAGAVCRTPTIGFRPVWNDDGHLVCWERWPANRTWMPSANQPEAPFTLPLGVQPTGSSAHPTRDRPGEGGQR